MDRIGPIMILEGTNYSKVPFSRSLFLDCSERVLIDSGADTKTLLDVDREYGVELLINTHYHPDHTLHNHLFTDAKKIINPIEFETSLTIEGVARANGVYQEWGQHGVERWKKSLPQEWVKNLGGFSGTYEYETNYSFGDVNVTFLHTPGHTSGLSCPYFPELGVVFSGDYDMTSFGPWYNGTDGNIDDFIASGHRLLTLDADTYITGHQKGIFSKQEFQLAMEKFLAIIERRDETIDGYVRKGLTFEELTNIGIFYPKKSLENTILLTWERSGIRKHLHRLGYTVPSSNTELVKIM
ncbi:MAG: MBL fold metallo-hydrolase [Bacillus sp. (in: firmicutes)]